AGAAADLDPWDDQVAALGAAVTLRRRDLVTRLAVAAGRIYRELSGGREELAVTYAANLSGADEAELVRTAKAAMAAQRQAERARGRTLVGPHRDEITLEVDRRLLRLYGSRGQQVAAALALRLAERGVLGEGALCAERWPAIAGPETAAHAPPAQLRGTTLLLEVDPGLWVQEVSARRGQLAAAINHRLGGQVVAEIRIRPARGVAVEAPRSAEEHREHERLELSAQELAAIDQTVAEIADPEVR